MKRLLALMGVISLVASGCSTKAEEITIETQDTSIIATEATALSFVQDDQFSNSDYEVGNIYGDYEEISLANNGSTSASENVTIDGNIITILAEGSYLLEGSLDEGQIIVDVEDDSDKVQLTLNGVSITNSTSATIYAKEADKVFITLEEGTTNTLTSTIVEDESAETNVDAVIFAKTDLTVNGGGNLVITGINGNGITSKDDLVVTGGDLEITVDKHGLEANNSIRIANGDFNITSGKDGFHSEHDEDTALGYIYILNGTFTIDAQGDGFDSSSYVEIVDGNFDITTGGGSVNAPEHVSTMGGGGGGMPMGGMNQQGRGEMTMNQSTDMSGQAVAGQEMQQGGRGTMDMTAIPEGEMVMPEMAMPEAGMMEQQMGGQGGMSQPGGMSQSGGMGQMAIPEGEMTMPEDTMAQGEMPERTEMSGMARGEMSATVTEETEDDTVSTKGIKATIGIVIHGGSFIIDSCDDAIHSNYTTEIMDGTFAIKTGDDAIHADVNTIVNGGTIVIATCYEGLEGHTIVVAGGDIDIYSLDDGINAASSEYVTDGTEVSITISGGRLVIDANDEGDGLDANGNIYMTGGEVIISGTPTTTDTSLDYNSTAVITGGSFLAAGSTSQTRQNFGDDSTQGSILVDLNAVQTGTITLTDDSGNVVVEWTPAKSYQSIHISTPDIVEGATYTLTTPEGTQTIVMDTLIYGEGGNHGAGGGGTRMGK